jgi:hypothetical protein
VTSPHESRNQAGYNTMQLTCKIDQAEAIRRGHDASSTIKLEIDPATLSQGQRETLAAHFSNGEFKSGYIYPLLPEPSIAGFLEALEKIMAKESEARELAAKREAENIEYARKQFAARKTRECHHTIYAAANRDGFIETSDRFIGEANERGVAQYSYLMPGTTTELATEFKRLLETPEGIAWVNELSAARDKAESEAIAKAIADCEANLAKTKARKEAKAKATEELRHWAIAHGSETLRLRTEEGMNWITLATSEMADSLLITAGITGSLADPEGYNPSSSEPEAPTAAQIKELRRIREAAASIPGLTAEVEMIDCEYTPEEDDGYNDEVIRRTEIRVELTLPTGKVIRYYPAE